MPNYLPSKKLIIKILIVLVIFLAILGIKTVASKNNQPKEGKNTDSKAKTVQELISEDSDGDGLTNWEEALWGIDPHNKSTNPEISDWDYVTNKRAEMKSKQPNPTETPSENQTDKFAKELFTTITALNQSGNLNSGMISNLSNNLSDKIVETTIDDSFSLGDIDMEPEVTNVNQKDYYEKVQQLFALSQVAGLGSELEIIARLDPNTDEFHLKLNNSSRAYIAFANNLKSLKTPSNLALKNLAIINSALKTGSAVKSLASITSDPIVGIVGLSQYQKYSQDFIEASEELRSYLINSDIISE